MDIASFTYKRLLKSDRFFPRGVFTVARRLAIRLLGDPVAGPVPL